MPSWTSPRVSAVTFPISRVMARAISSLCWTSRSPTRCNTSPRIGAGVLYHWAKPRCAAATARATSSGPERGKQPITSFQSAGLRFSKYAPVVGATHSPAMKFLKLSAISRQPSARKLDVRAQPERARVGADARQHFTGQKQDSPNDQDLRHDVREPHAPPPRGDARPQTGGDDRGDADQIEDQPQATAVGVRPHTGGDADGEQDPQCHLRPGGEPAAAARPQRRRGDGTAGDGRPPNRRLAAAAAERGIGVRQLLEQAVDLRHLLVPVPILLDPRHYASRVSP